MTPKSHNFASPSHTSKHPLRLPLLASVLMTAAFSPSADALLIVPTFDSSITGDPNGASMMTGINLAIAQMESALLNPVTVNIEFKNVNFGLGESSTFFSTPSYSQYLSDLTNNQTLSPNDITALATLPAGPNNPVNAGTSMFLTLPLLRAIGEPVLGDNGGGFDSTISLNMSLMNFLRTGPQDPGKYDLEQVTLHEIVEVLGSGGAGSTLGGAGTDIGSMDLFRYSANGVRSYGTSAILPYFSINGGATNLSFFNQTAGADYGDWDGAANPNPQVQDAFSTTGLQLDLSANELTELDVVGWNLNPVPEPGSLALLGMGSILILRRRRA